MLKIGKKIQGLREVKDLSQDDLADRCRVNRSTVDRWEKPDADLNAGRLKQIADVLQVRVGYFFDELPDLVRRPYRRVAARESVRRFLLASGVPEAEHQRHRLWRAVDAKDAPVTSDGWKARAEFLRSLSGKARQAGRRRSSAARVIRFAVEERGSRRSPQRADSRTTEQRGAAAPPD